MVDADPPGRQWPPHLTLPHSAQRHTLVGNIIAVLHNLVVDNGPAMIEVGMTDLSMFLPGPALHSSAPPVSLRGGTGPLQSPANGPPSFASPAVVLSRLSQRGSLLL